MGLVEDIQNAVKSGKVILGYRQALKLIKTGSPKVVVIAKNIPENMKKTIEENAKIGNVEVKTFDGSSIELGITCGKSFPVSTLVIKSG